MKDSDISTRVAEFILTRNHEELAALDERKLAEVFGINRSLLSRSFKRRQKMAVDRFILRERLYRAFFWIEKARGISGRELSRQLRFDRFEDFGREFKKLFLLTPDRFIALKRRQGKPKLALP